MNKWWRRGFLACGIVFGVLTGGPALAASRPNVLLIVAEDLSPMLGCYGDETAITPHLDGLSARSHVFDRMYCNSPVCNPSRTSFLTGVRPEQTGLLENRQKWRPVVSEYLTLPEHFRQSGYRTIRLGKIFHNDERDRDGQFWDEVFVAEERAPKVPFRTAAKAVPAEYYEQDEITATWMSHSLLWGPSGLSVDETRDGQYVREARQVIGRQHDQPFFLAVGFHTTHLPFTAPDQYFEKYPIESVALPWNPKDDLKDVPEAAYGMFQSLDQVRITDREWAELRQAFYAMITFLDDNVGALLQALETSPYADNTIVIFVSDHGFQLGEHFLWRKELLFERSMRVPFMVHVPGQVQGRRLADVSELLDLYPTLSELCSLRTPRHVEGRSLLPLMQGTRLPGQDALGIVRLGPDNEIGNYVGRSIRSDRWRLNLWMTDPPQYELYDHRYDPGEFHNLARFPEFAFKVEELEQRLAAWPLGFTMRDGELPQRLPAPDR